MHRLVTDEEAGNLAELAERWDDPGATADTLAFLQYTSGSTAAPKGVMITHGNLLDNSARIQASFGSTPESRGVFWLPLFHDMGLIGGVIQTLYCGGSSTLFSPVSFLQRPLRWLQAISRTGATISGGPNFAYDLCVEKTTPEQRAALDLSCWRVAFNGAEPVRAGDARPLRRSVRPGRVPARSLPALLRPGRGDAARLGRSLGPRRPSCSRSTPMPSGAARSPRRAASRQGKRLVGSGQVVAGHRVVDRRSRDRHSGVPDGSRRRDLGLGPERRAGLLGATRPETEKS